LLIWSRAMRIPLARWVWSLDNSGDFSALSCSVAISCSSKAIKYCPASDFRKNARYASLRFVGAFMPLPRLVYQEVQGLLGLGVFQSQGLESVLILLGVSHPPGLLAIQAALLVVVRSLAASPLPLRP